MICNKGMEKRLGLILVSMKDIIGLGKNMGLELISGKMEVSIEACESVILLMEKEFIRGLMEGSIRVLG